MVDLSYTLSSIPSWNTNKLTTRELIKILKPKKTKMLEYNSAMLRKLGTRCIHGMMFNFMCQLDWASGYPDIWSNIISGCVYKGVSWETGIWVGELSKADCPSQCGWAWYSLLRTWIKQKGGGRENSISVWLLELEHWSSFALGLGFIPSVLLVLRPLDSN